VSSTEKRDVIIKVTDKGLKEVTVGLNKLHKLITDIEATPLTVGGSVKSAALDKATKSTKKYAGSISEADRAAKSLANTNTSSTKGFAKQAQGLGGLVHIYATVAANIWAMGAAFEQLSQAADLRAVIQAQDELASSSGRSLKAVTKALYEGADGALSLANSMKLANTVASAGFGAGFAADITKIAGGASKALGRDLTDSIERLTKGIAKMEPEILDELGIFVKLERATRKYADANNLAVKDLTEFERRQAFANEALEQGTAAWGDLNDKVGANPYKVLSASLANVKDSMVGVISGGLEATGVLSSFAESTKATTAGIYLLAQRLTKMAIPELKNFGNAFKTKAIDSATAAFNRFDTAAENSVTRSGTIKGFAVMREGATRAGAAMHSAFVLGASGASKAEANLDLLNLQLFSTGRLATKAAGAMLFLGKAVNKLAGWASKLGKALGWVAMAQVAFTLLEGAVKKVLGHFKLLDGLTETFDRIGAATGLWDPSGISAVDDALVDLTKNLEAPLKGFKALEEQGKDQFVSPVKRAKVLSNVLLSLQDEVLNLNTELSSVPTDSVAYQEIGDRSAKGLDSFIKTAKQLKQTDLAEELEAIKEAASPKTMSASLKKATHLINMATEAAGRYTSALEGQQKGVEDLNSATKRYYDSTKVSTKLDDILGFYDTTQIDAFITRLDTVNSINIDPKTQDASDKFRKLTVEVDKYQAQFDSFKKATGVHLEVGTSLDVGGFIGGLVKSKKELAEHLEYVKAAGIEMTGADVLPELSQEEVDVFVHKMSTVKDSFLGLLGLSGGKVKGLRTILKGIEAGDSVDTSELSNYMVDVRNGVEAVIKSQQKLRASALEINKITAEGAAARLSSATALNKLTDAKTLGKISKEQLQVETLKLQLAGQQSDRLLAIRTLKERILQLDIDAARRSDIKSAEGEAARVSLEQQAGFLRDEVALLNSVSNTHTSISNQLVARLEVQQQLNASVRENIDMARNQVELAKAQAAAKFGTEEQGLAEAEALQPDEDFSIQSAKLEIERELSALNAIKMEQLAAETVLREELRLIEDEYLNGALLQAGSADALAITRLTTKISQSQKLLAISKLVSAEKQKELKINLEMAKIVSPFEKLAKVLDELDTSAFTALAKGANKFVKVTKVNRKQLDGMAEGSAAYNDQQLQGYADQASALGGMFDEGSASAQAFAKVEQAIHVARMAAMVLEESAMLRKAAASMAAEFTALFPKVAGAMASIVSGAGIPGIAIAAGFAALVMGMSGGGGGGGGATTAGVDAQLKQHKDNLGANGVSGAREMETNALTGAITDLADIDTRLYSSMDNLQGSIIELGKTFRSIGGSTSRAFGGFSERGIQEQFSNIPEFGKGLVERGAYKRPIERTLEDVLLQIAPDLSTIDVDPSSIKKATDFLAVSFDDITALIITKSLRTKASDGSLKGAWVDKLQRNFGNEYADQLSKDLNDAFNSTIDSTFGLLQALDPGAHIGEASNEFTTSVASALMGVVNTGSFGADLSSSISVKDLSSSEAADRISVYFNGLSDDMIMAIFPALNNFRDAGEELGDTLARMVEETATATNAFSLLGLPGSIFDPGVMTMAGVSANIAFQDGLFSGFSDAGAWAEIADSFTEVILSEVDLISNRINASSAEVARGLERSLTQIGEVGNVGGAQLLGEELRVLSKDMEDGAITSKQALLGFKTVWDQYKNLMVSASSGVDLSGNLISEETLTTLGELDSTIMSTVNALGVLMESEDELVNAAIDATGRTLQDYLDLLTSLQDAVLSLILGDLSPLSAGQKLEVSKEAFDGLVVSLGAEEDNSKRFELLEGVEDAATEYLSASKEYFSGAGNYVLEFERVRAILDSLAMDLGSVIETDFETQTLSLLEATYDLQAKAADNIVGGLAAVQDALQSYQAPTGTYGSGASNPPPTLSAQVLAAAQPVAPPTPTKPTLSEYFQGGGGSIFDYWAEWGTPTFAEGGITSTASIAGEAGPEAVVPLPDGRTIPVTVTQQAETSPELLEELRLLRATIEEQARSNEEMSDIVVALLQDSNVLSGSIVKNTKSSIRAL